MVQLREQANVESGQWMGRIEHVTSGQAAHFHTVEELLGFVVRVSASAAKTRGDE